MPPKKDRRRTELVATCTTEEHELLFNRAWAESRLISEYVREQLGFRADGWVQPGRRRR
jgi:hypothetical protein